MAAAECYSQSGGFYGERNEDLFKTEAAEPDTGSKDHGYLMKLRSNEDKVCQFHLSKKNLNTTNSHKALCFWKIV